MVTKSSSTFTRSAEAPCASNATDSLSLEGYGLRVAEVFRNPAPATLYEHALRDDPRSALTAPGALLALSGEKTGRSPKDKRVVERADSVEEVWWGEVNTKLSPRSFEINRKRALDALNACPRLYVIDGYAGWDPAYRLKCRIVCARAYHALFMHNMLIRPSASQLVEFGEPECVIFNAGHFPANPLTEGLDSSTSVALDLEAKEMVILGTEYAGEMKKGVFTLMNYLMPKRDVLSMHCSATEGSAGDTSVLFGLSGTGKTTLSADPKRRLIGDDEHCWSDLGVFNIEGGCYAKVIDLSEEAEPDIYRAIRFGTVLENVVLDEATRGVDFGDTRITKNTRASYPIEFMDSVKLPCVGAHPKNVLFLTCDAFGILPPVSKLSPSQAMYHFISGYTAKVAGTEVGVTDPEATFSPCFAGPFLVWHPGVYAELLATKLRQHGAQTWLVNTGWSGGPFGVGKRMKIGHTRAIVDAIHDGSLHSVETVEDPLFGLSIPTSCPGVPSEVLVPWNTWGQRSSYDVTARRLAGLFEGNFERFADGVSSEVLDAGPQL